MLHRGDAIARSRFVAAGPCRTGAVSGRLVAREKQGETPMRRGFPLFLLAGLAAAPLLAEPGRADEGFDAAVRDVLGGDPGAYRDVLATLQAAVRAGDAAGVAALVSYPITVTIDGARREIADAPAFVAAYPSIVTPRIAAAVESESIADMFVNYQGVMLGDGEIWLTGVCAPADTACDRPEIKVITIQSTDDLAPAGPDATPGVARSFGDWVVGCDNYRACVAVGMMPDQEAGAYVVIRRGGGAKDRASVAFSTLVERAPAHPKLRVSILGDKAGPRDAEMAVEGAGSYLTATADPADVSGLIAALGAGRGLELTPLDRGKPGETAGVSLKGSAASLLYMDDQQRRVGTTTALVRPGKASADTIPAVILEPVWQPRPIAEVTDTSPPPAYVAPATDPSCDGVPTLAFSVAPDTTLWAVCALAGAYNTDFTFWIVGPDGARKADFSIPGQPGDGDPATLMSPSLAADGLTLNSLALGRGLGDCGTVSDWGWDGAALRLVSLRDMPTCRGVDMADWPVLFRAAPR
jgi:hypothetical protein